MDVYCIDGQFVSDDKAFVSVKDLVVLRSFGVFELLITYNRRPFHLEEHVMRLANSARSIGLEIGNTNSEICEIVRETVKRNPHHRESTIRIVCTGGISSDGLNPEGRGSLIVMVAPRAEPPAEWYTQGAKVITIDLERFIPAAKSTSYLTAVYAMQLASRQNGMEAIYVDRDNCIREGTTTSFFCFKNSKLVTPRRGILPGITRSIVMELAKEFYDVETRDVRRSELSELDEVFITASNKEVVPIVQVDDLRIGSGRVGGHTRKIMQLFRSYTDSYGQGRSGLALPAASLAAELA